MNIWNRGALVALALSGGAMAAESPGSRPEVMYAVRHDISAPMSDVLRMAQPAPVEPTDQVPNIFLKPNPLTAVKPEWVPDLPGVQRAPTGTPMPAPLQSFNGITNSTTIIPPDTVGDVGVNEYLQWVNLRWAVYNKNTGALIAGPTAGNSFWSGFGGVCQTNNSGDPIVLFDDVAQRWVVSQFTGSGTPRQCFAVSTTSDPLGSYHRYEFVFPRFNDYPHIGIWIDESGARSGYYFVVHEFTGNTFNGASFVAVDRDRMLVGAPAAQVAMVRFPNINNYGALPPHLEGTTKAKGGTCAPFVHFNAANDTYLFWDFCVDWTNTANTTLSPAPQAVAASAPFSNDFGQSPQAGTTALLDTFALNVMYRASARTFPAGAPTETSLVLNHTVNAGGGKLGVRWAHFDLRAPVVSPPTGTIFANGFDENTAPLALTKTLVDDGTYAPDGDNRWMGSIAIDKNGYIGLGYTAASATLNPQVRYAGRTHDDADGTLRDEGSCTAGIANGSQTDAAARWGDYSSMSVDPVDDCTFWYTTEYYPVSSARTWSTRICSFKLPNCGNGDFALVPESPTRYEICGTTGSNPTINFRGGIYNGFSGSATLSLTGIAGVTPSFGINPLVLPGSTSVTLSGATALASGEYSGSIVGVSGATTRSIGVSLGISSAAGAAPTLTAPANGATGVLVRPALTWNAVPGALRYRVVVATDAAFANTVSDQVVTGTSATPTTSLSPSTQYFWRVTAQNYCGDGAISATFNFTTGVPGQCPAGTTPNQVFFDNNEADTIVWGRPAGVGNNTWVRQTGAAGTGMTSRVWFADNVTTQSNDQPLISPAIVLPVAAQQPISLTYQARHVYEVDGTAGCWDGAILDISTNGGASWTQLNAELLTDPYDGVSSGGTNPTGAGVPMWCRSAAGAVTSVVNLNAYAGQTIQLRYRSTGDDNTGGTEPNGIQIDDIRVFGCQ